MAKTKITEYSNTAVSNTDVGNIQIEGSDDVANFDNALRELMKHIADLNTGDSFIHDTYKIADSDAETKLAKFDAGSITAGQTRTFIFPDKNGTFAMSEDVPVIPNIALIDTADDGSKNTALNIPSGTTAQRPSLPDGYQVRRNITTGEWEGWDTANWGRLAAGRYDAILEEQQTSSTEAGAFTSGSWVTRTLNTTVKNVNSVLALSSNEFTPASDGEVEWSCPAFAVGSHVSRLYNVTDSTVVQLGTSAYANEVNFVANTSTGVANVISGKTYKLEHRCQTTKSTNGLGVASNIATNVYSQLKFRRN